MTKKFPTVDPSYKRLVGDGPTGYRPTIDLESSRYRHHHTDQKIIQVQAQQPDVADAGYGGCGHGLRRDCVAAAGARFMRCGPGRWAAPPVRERRDRPTHGRGPRLAATGDVARRSEASTAPRPRRARVQLGPRDS